MTVLYADTSALVRAYFVDEPEHLTLRRVLLEGDIPVVSSEISRLELSSAVAAAARAGRLREPETVLDAFDGDCSDEGVLTLLRLDPEVVLPLGVRLVREQRLRSLDAIHLAVALTVPPLLGIDDLVVVTRDAAQAAAAEALGLAVR